MKVRPYLLGAALALATSLGGAAQAQTVFSEDFSGATPGFGYTGRITGTKFTASRDVDIVGQLNGSFFSCGPLNPGGNCIDLIGGTGPGGTTTSTQFSLAAGVLYTLAFDDAGMAGNVYSAAVDGFSQTFLSVGSVVNNSFSFTPLTSTDAATLAFTTITSPDSSHGPTLANIRITGAPTAPPGAVPEPASWAMMIVGFAMIGAGLRYRRRWMVFRYA